MKVGGYDSQFDTDIIKHFSCRLGVGMYILFWEARWLGQIPLVSLYPKHYEISSNRKGCVSDMGVWIMLFSALR